MTRGLWWERVAEVIYARIHEGSMAVVPDMLCNSCRWTEIQSQRWISAGQTHESETGHRVTAWDGATSQLPREFWTTAPAPPAPPWPPAPPAAPVVGSVGD